MTIEEGNAPQELWYLSRVERDRIDQVIAQRLLQLQREPYVQAPNDFLELKKRSIFASVAYARAGEQAKKFSDCFPDANADSLRFITLRHEYKGGLLDTINAMSEMFNKKVSYCIKQRLGIPQLTVVHIRIRPDHTYDIHFQGIWSIEAANISRLKKTLERGFTPVWIDQDLVASPKKACFYLCARIMDHGMMEQWEDAKLAEVWDLPSKTRLIRPAGGFRSGESGPSISPRPSPFGLDAEIEPVIQRPLRLPTGAVVSKPTVRSSRPDLALGGPTVEQMDFVFYLLERLMEGPSSLERWCRITWRSHETALEAITTVQSYADWEPLFTMSQSPDRTWNITDEGRRVWSRHHKAVHAICQIFI